MIGESQLVGYPSQFPSVSMMDYNNGKPNARIWVLKLIKDNFHPGDKLVAETGRKADDGAPSDIMVQGFITPQGKKSPARQPGQQRKDRRTGPGSAEGFYV